jgi:hypothetical protein
MVTMTGSARWPPPCRRSSPATRSAGVSGVDTHHDHFRFAWDLVGPDGAVAVGGIDVGEVADDGRLQRITGFYGPLPDKE